MKSFFWRYKFISLAIAAACILVPVVAFGVIGSINTTSGGYKVLKGAANTVVYPTGYSATCVTNSSTVSSPHDYFIPTKTSAEFASILAHTPTGLTFGICCGDSICNGSEACSSCSGDCGSCTYCGDSSCNGSETCSSCSSDCGSCGGYCGDGICSGETCYNASGYGCLEDCGECSVSDCGSARSRLACLALDGCLWDGTSCQGGLLAE